jgi:hypothetical protein
MQSGDERAEAIRRGHALRELGWPNLAADVSEGLSPDAALERLREIGEGESGAARLIRGWSS